MKRHLWSPYVGLVVTGTIATIVLLIEPELHVPSDIHFFLQLVWVGVVGGALLTCALMPALTANSPNAPPRADGETNTPSSVTAEFFDEDRVWLQTHPDASWNEQV